MLHYKFLSYTPGSIITLELIVISCYQRKLHGFQPCQIAIDIKSKRLCTGYWMGEFEK